MNGIGGYNAGPPEHYQCEVCGGWFSNAHFCIGRNENTPKSKNEIIKELREQIATQQEVTDNKGE